MFKKVRKWLREIFAKTKREINLHDTTPEFRSFEKYFKKEHGDAPHERILASFIINTTESPFVGDNRFQEALQFLVEESIRYAQGSRKRVN